MTDLSRGFIFSATGEVYVRLARRAAESCRAHMPDIPIDLFTDQPIEDEVFDKVHILEDPWKRSKIDAMASTRFRKTVFLDADVFVLDRIDDIFTVLDRFDLCGVHDQLRTTWNAMKIWRTEVPECFPQINTGMIGFRKKKATIELFREWSRVVRENNMWRDQPAFRDLVWESKLRLMILPEEYNYMALHTFKAFSNRNADPKVIHSPKFHFKMEYGDKFLSVEDLLGERLSTKMAKMRARRQSMTSKKRRRSKNL